MIRVVFCGLLCAFLIGATPVAQAAQPDRNILTVQWPGPPPPPPAPPPSGSVEWAEHVRHCRHLKHHLDRLGWRMERSAPWQRDRIAAEFYQTRERLRIECLGW